jgi:hypothetical protein
VWSGCQATDIPQLLAMALCPACTITKPWSQDGSKPQRPSGMLKGIDPESAPIYSATLRCHAAGHHLSPQTPLRSAENTNDHCGVFWLVCSTPHRSQLKSVLAPDYACVMQLQFWCKPCTVATMHEAPDLPAEWPCRSPWRRTRGRAICGHP